MKTLIIHYLPSAENSRTLRLLQAFRANIQGVVRELDLLENQPEFMTPAVKNALFKRSYAGQTLNATEQALVAKNDFFLAELRAADVVVFVYPMHNYGLPAIVKAFFDAVIIKDETFSFEDFTYRGLLTGRRALALITSGGIYEGPEGFSDMDCCFKLHNILCHFVGFDATDVISVQGTDMLPPDQLDARFAAAEHAIQDYCAALAPAALVEA